MNEFRINLVQYDIAWHDIEGNHAKVQKLCEDMPSCHLLLLPEMFNTGFSMQPSAFKNQAARAGLDFMYSLVQTYRTAVCGSLITEENGRYYNRLYFLTPEGEEYTYDKRHLFTLAGEQHQYTPGHSKTCISYRQWNILPLICYDLRFPVWSRQSPENPYDLLLYVANWPQRRSHAWRTLLPARAIENMAYTAGVNRVGYDATGVYHSGDSAVYDVLGQQITQPASDTECILSATLSLSELRELRHNLGFLNDADAFSIQ